MPPSAVPTPDEIWKILKEVSSNQKETSEQMKETASFSSEQMKETDKRLKKARENLFTTQWGRTDGKPGRTLCPGFADHPESTGNPAIIENTSTNVKQRGRGDNYEYDIIAVNGKEIVVVEVKTTLKVNSVKDFLRV